MSLLNYFQWKKDGQSFPNPYGPLSRFLSPAAIQSANSEVRKVCAMQASGCLWKNNRKGKKPRVLSDTQRVEMGKLTCRVGPTEAAKRFLRKLGLTINKSTMRSIKKDYVNK